MKGTQIIAGRGRPSNNRSWPEPTPEEYADSWSDSFKPGGTNYIGKSFFEHAQGYPVLLEGVDVSDALFDVVKSLGEMFESFEARVASSIDEAFGESSEFDHSLGKSVIAIGHGVNSMGERVEQLQYESGEMSKSLSFNVPGSGHVSYLNKGSFGEEGPSREEVLNVLLKGLETGQVSAADIIKFESGGGLSDDLAKSFGL